MKKTGRKINSPEKQSAIPAGLLWIRWERTFNKHKRRVVLIEVDDGIKWTAQALNDKIIDFLELLGQQKSGAKIAFCLPNGASWMAFFLALQKLGLSAIPLDASLPDQACLEMAQQLGCRALYLRGKLHVFETGHGDKRGICCIKVTSGTSGGLPKTVPCRAEHLIADGMNIIRTMGIRPNDRNLVTIPLGHSYGLGNFVLPLILQGTALVCAKHFVPRQLIEWIRFHRTTVFPSVPAIFCALASMPVRFRLTPLRLAISAGAPLTAEVARAFFERFHLEIHNFYGSSETGGICYDRKGDATLEGRSVGKPLTGVTVRVDHGAIEVESSAVAKRGGRWRMPDRGEWNSQGEIVLLGRQGREINIGGKKVHPSEVEHALQAVPGITEAIIWVRSQSERSFLQAAVETRLSLGEVQKALALRLPEWKFPKRYFITTELPRTARGKVDVTALRRKMAEKAY
jgi:acyl-CoA synthetase (AMP-forming)/AMP-acid ligase II